MNRNGLLSLCVMSLTTISEGNIAQSPSNTRCAICRNYVGEWVGEINAALNQSGRLDIQSTFFSIDCLCLC